MIKQYVDVIRDATKAVPAVRYALGIAGVMAAFALGTSFFSDARVAFFATLAMLALMILLVLFARLSTQGPTVFKAPATVLVWAMTLLFVLSSTLTVSGVFFDYPKPFPQLVRDLFAKSADPVRPQALEVTAAAVGRQITTIAEPPKVETPRSDSVNVGCESDGGARVTYIVPEGAKLLRHSARWIDIDNIRDHSARTEASNGTILAIGGLRGLDKQFGGNCPGGGHATLELTVEVQIAKREEAPTTIPIGISQLVDKPVSFSPPATPNFELTGYSAGIRPVGSTDTATKVDISGCAGTTENTVTRTVSSANLLVACGTNGLRVERLQ